MAPDAGGSSRQDEPMSRFGDGLATGPDLRVAAEEATASALAPLAGHAPDLVCVFVCADSPDEVEEVGRRVAELTGSVRPPTPR